MLKEFITFSNFPLRRLGTQKTKLRTRGETEQSKAKPKRSEQTGVLFPKKTKLRKPERSEQTGVLFPKKTKLR